jgi:lysophospholipid acyltransferase (LPLAT)-like uncharacterized protein
MRLRPPACLLYAIARPWLGSLRVHHFGIDQLRNGVRGSVQRSVMICLWHQSLLSIIAPAQHSGLRLAALASLSGDGAIIASYLERVGIRTLRGSSARGAAVAAKSVMQAIADRWHPVLAVDGPRGPARVVKGGALEIARLHGIPIVPVAARSSNELQISRSWDRFRVPLPGAHIALVYGRPLIFPSQEPSAAELVERGRQLGAILDGLEAQATRTVLRFAPKSRFRPSPPSDA